MRIINLNDPDELNKYNRMTLLAEKLQSLHELADSVEADSAKAAYERQINDIHQQIGQLVYELFDLTEEEIDAVESGY